MLTISQIVDDKYDEEVLGLLVIEEGKNGKGLTVVNVITPEQKIGSASCEMVIGETISQKEIPKELVPKIKGWWHSHKTMGVFFSTTDDTTLENWASMLPYAVGVVVSLPDKIKAFLQYGKPYLSKQIEMEVKVNFPSVGNLREELEKELDKKIIKKEAKKTKQTKGLKKICCVTGCRSEASIYIPRKTSEGLIQLCPQHYKMWVDGNIEERPEPPEQQPTPTELEEDMSLAYACDYLQFRNKDWWCLETDKKPDCRVCVNNPTKQPIKTQPIKPQKKQPKVNVWFDCKSLRILTNTNKLYLWHKAKRKLKKKAINPNDNSASLLCSYLQEPPSCDFCGIFHNREWVKETEPKQETEKEQPLTSNTEALIKYVKELPNCSFPNCENKATVLEAFSGNDKKPVCDNHVTSYKHKLLFYKQLIGD